MKRERSASRRHKQRARKDQEQKKKKQESPFQPGKGGFGKQSASPFATTYAPQKAATSSAAPWVGEPKSTPSSAELEAQLEFAAAVREQYPDLSKAPQRVRDQVEKIESATTVDLSAQLVAANTKQDAAKDKILQLQKSKDAHKKKWLGHLESSIKSWKNQVENFHSQQKRYDLLINAEKEEFQKTNSTIQKLNTRVVGASQVLPTLPDSSDVEDFEAQETQMRDSMMQILTKCAQGTDPIDVDAEESNGAPEDPNLPNPKRPRAMEPFGGSAS